MVLSKGMNRVSRQTPCVACGKPDWCLWDEGVALCMRVESSKPVNLSSGEIGWLHKEGYISRPTQRRKEKEDRPTINAAKIHAEWEQETSFERLEKFAKSLGVRTDSLARLGVVWSNQHRAWAFPMRDSIGAMIGLRLRNEEGQKWSVTGSKSGLFFAPTAKPQGRHELLFVVEGATDTLAAISLAFWVVGKPSCGAGNDFVTSYAKRWAAHRAVIVSDNDAPGRKGAEVLSDQIGIPSCVLILPNKDLRKSCGLGCSKLLIESMIKSLKWKGLK